VPVQIDHITSLLEDVRSILSRESDSGKWQALEALGTGIEELRVTEMEVWRQTFELAETRTLLEHERRRYRDLFELAPDAFLETDPQGLILAANEAAARLFNLPLPFLVAKPLPVLVSDTDRAGFRAELVRLVARSGVSRYVLRVRCRKQGEISVVAAVAKLPGPASKGFNFVWSLRDNTLIERAEQQLLLQNDTLARQVRDRTAQLEEEMAAREQLLIDTHTAYSASNAPGQTLLDLLHGLSAIIWKMDAATGRFTFVSQHAEEVFGPDAGRWDHNSAAWDQLVHPDDREYVQRLRERARRDGEHYEAEYRLNGVVGRTLWFRENVRVITGRDDRPAELRALMVDISRRKRIERQLYVAKTELQTRLDDMTYLHELLVRLSAAMDSRAQWNEALDAVMALLGAEKGIAFVLADGTGLLRVAAWSGLADDLTAPLAAAIANAHGPGEAGPLVIADMSTASDPSLHWHNLLALGIRGLVVIPVRTSAGHTVGRIASFFTSPGRPKTRPLSLAVTYAAQAAAVLENHHHDAFA
jgi:PAS domain S-box-containing protein